VFLNFVSGIGSEPYLVVQVGKIELDLAAGLEHKIFELVQSDLRLPLVKDSFETGMHIITHESNSFLRFH